MRVLTAAQMREADQATIEDIGIPEIVLMENAGRQVVSAMEATFASALEGRVAVLSGTGNNGGDGFVVARTLLQRGVDVAVFVVGPIASVKGAARTNLEILGRLGVNAVEIDDEQTWDLHFSEIAQCRLIVDGLFGTGLSRPLSGMLETVVADVNTAGIPIVAIDLPSGLLADTPHLPGACIDASMTVTLAAPKLPLVLPPGEMHAGDVVVADIGIPSDVIARVDGPVVELLTHEEVRALVDPRAPDAHKGDFGRLLIVAGSRGMTGAAFLAGMGALRSGAGRVTVATPASVQPVVASMAPEYMTLPLAENGAGEITDEALDAVLAVPADVVACGPGLGRGPGAAAFVRGLLERCGAPLVLDADALAVLGDDTEVLTGRDDRPVVITPHPGEMARLTGLSVDEVQVNRLQVALGLAESRQIYVVLKGYRTVVAAPDGRVAINPTGNAGMATGGTGDVLTGVIAAWLAQLLDAERACRLGVFLHGAAGDLAEAEDGQSALVASDLLQALGPALRQLTAPRTTSAS
ncbi:MAG: NAD(P)H-hydrate dehydratase [Vicinamibacterales bacterium]